MKRLLTILVFIKMSTAGFGQINHLHDGQNETIYEKAIQVIVKDSTDLEPIFIMDQSYISNFFWDREIKGRTVVFINDTNQSAELRKNGNLMRVYEIEYPMIAGDQLQIKINHMVIFEIDLAKGEKDWPIKLSDKEREHARNRIEKVKLSGGGHEVKTYSSIIQNAWSYVIFVFDTKDKEFKIQKVETKTM